MMTLDYVIKSDVTFLSTFEKKEEKRIPLNVPSKILKLSVPDQGIVYIPKKPPLTATIIRKYENGVILKSNTVKKIEIKYQPAKEIPAMATIERGTSEEVPAMATIKRGTSEEVPIMATNKGGMSEEVPVMATIKRGTSEEVPVMATIKRGASEEVPVMATNKTHSEEVPVMATNKTHSEEVPVMATNKTHSEKVPVMATNKTHSEKVPTKKRKIEYAQGEDIIDLTKDEKKDNVVTISSDIIDLIKTSCNIPEVIFRECLYMRDTVVNLVPISTLKKIIFINEHKEVPKTFMIQYSVKKIIMLCNIIFFYNQKPLSNEFVCKKIYEILMIYLTCKIKFINKMFTRDDISEDDRKLFIKILDAILELNITYLDQIIPILNHKHKIVILFKFIYYVHKQDCKSLDLLIKSQIIIYENVKNVTENNIKNYLLYASMYYYCLKDNMKDVTTCFDTYKAYNKTTAYYLMGIKKMESCDRFVNVLKYFNNSIKSAPESHYSYFALSLIHFNIENNKRAEEYMILGIENGSRDCVDLLNIYFVFMYLTKNVSSHLYNLIKPYENYLYNIPSLVYKNLR